MRKNINFKIKRTKTVVFLTSVILTAVIAFWLPTSYYFFPKAADSMGIEVERENQTYTVFSDKAVYITQDWEFYWQELMVSEGHKLYKPDLVVDLPSAWTTYQLDGERLTSGGYATYRKVLKEVYKND